LSPAVSCTVRTTGEEVVELPWLSVATAVSAYVPASSGVQETEKGALVTVPSRIEPW